VRRASPQAGDRGASVPLRTVRLAWLAPAAERGRRPAGRTTDDPGSVAARLRRRAAGDGTSPQLLAARSEVSDVRSHEIGSSGARFFNAGKGGSAGSPEAGGRLAQRAV